MTVILNGKASNTKPEDVIAINGQRAIELPPTINGYVPTDITINGYDRPPVLPGCVLYLPLWHSKLSRSSPIYSIDKYGHECTVTGAIWTLQGRSFDGVDDKIVITTLPFSDYPFTLVAWIYCTDKTYWNVALSIGAYATNQHYDIRTTADGYAELNARNISPKVITDNVDITNEWHLLTGVFTNKTSRALYRDATLVGTDSVSVDFAPNTDQIWVGEMRRSASVTTPFHGTIGESLAYNSAFNQGNVSNYYNATKWRYQ